MGSEMCIRDRGTTILLTTHYLEEAEQLCDKIAFINEGQIVAQGSSDDLSETYGVANLEDAYLSLVGRRELSRSHVEGGMDLQAQFEAKELEEEIAAEEGEEVAP